MSDPVADHNAIAIVGLSGRWPGADNVADFWANLCAGKESVRTFTDAELLAAGVPEEDLRRPDYVRTRAPLNRPEWFDAEFFEFNPREAELTDPQQRVFLECAWSALEDAGIDPSRYTGSIGVWAGSSLNTYLLDNIGSHRERIAEFVRGFQADGYPLLIGNDKDYLATRVAYKLNLRGPAINVQTACSTSLVAVVQAVNALLGYQCDAALAGGVSISFPQERGYLYQEDAIASADGHTRAFDAEARGTVFGAGCGVVVLKRLADALADRDQVYAVIRGAAVNNDGHEKVSFVAPSVNGQAEVVALAHALAEVNAADIKYVEAHGTGTPLGDPIEVSALTQAFRATTEERGYCLLGTVKTNVGHLECAAGVTGLIKTALALQAEKLPPSLNFTRPNPRLELDSSPFRVVTELTPWPRGEQPRFAGVSSFGVGGTNAHCVVAEAPPPAPLPAEVGPQLLVLSARSLRALEDATTNLVTWLRRHPDCCPADVASTLQTGRKEFAYRRFVVASTVAEATKLLARRDRRRVFSTKPAPVAPASPDSLTALGLRWLAGETVDWTTLHTEPRQRVSLPTYPFQRSRFWIEPERTKAPAAKEEAPAAPAPTDPFSALVVELTALSGADLTAATRKTTLLDLGFDSLFLTQVAVNLQKRFGVKLRFRQLLEELSTLGALADFCAQGKPVGAAAAKSAPAPQTAAPTESIPAPKPMAFGPFRPAQTTATATFSPQQQAHLDSLIERYARKTPGSKQRTQEHRRTFADPRSVAGFRPYWKEMVYPIVTVRSAGSRLWDVDGNEYIDITMGFGTNLLGHAPAFISEAIQEQMSKGFEVGPQSPLAGEVADLLCELTGHDRAAFCNTGSEAVLAAIRLARTVNGRARIATTGGYHGICDEVLVRSSVTASGRRTVPIAPGVPDHVAREVLVLDYGTEESLRLLREQAHDLAAILIEPVQSRHPDLQPREFIQAVRKITAETGTVLIMDEVINGFRCHLNGAQAHFGVKSDIGTWGKIIGGGMPIGAVTGSAEYMDALDGGFWQFGDASFPEVGVTFFAGTYVRHPLALAASRAMLRYLKEQGPRLQDQLNERTSEFVGRLNRWLIENEAPLHIEHFSSLFYLHFAPEAKFGSLLYFHLREKGLHIWEGRPCFLSTAHTAADIEEIIRIFQEGVREMLAADFLPRRRMDEPKQARPNVANPIEFATGPIEDGKRLPLSDWQRGLWATGQLGGHATRAYNEGTTLELRGPLDLSALRKALQQIVDRHEAFRTSIEPDGSSLLIRPQASMEVLFEDHSTTSAAALKQRFLDFEKSEFDLAQPPVLKALVAKTAEDRHLLVLLYHHVLGNGPSYWVLFDELVDLYRAAKHGESIQLEPALQLSDFLKWQSDRENTEANQEDESFWLSHLSGGPAPLELPADRARPAVRTFQGDRRLMRLDETLTRRLRETGSRHGSSLFMMLFSACKVWLGRLAGQDDFVVGVPADSSVRELPGGTRLFANTTNMLPLRARIADDASFDQLLRETKSQVLSAAEHQEYFFGHLLQRLGIPFDLSRPALFSVSFNYESGKFHRETDGLSFELITEDVPYRSARDISPFDLVINIAEKDGALYLECDFNADILTGDTVARWLGHYRTLLEAIVEDAARPVGKLPLLSSTERQQILVDWNSTAAPQPAEFVHETISRQAVKTPAAIAVTCGSDSLTYAELDRRSSVLAAHLVSLGAQPRQFIGVSLGRCVEMAVAVVGILKAGSAYVPLDPAFPAARLEVMVQDAAMPFIVTRSDVEGLPNTAAKLVQVDRLPDIAPLAAPVSVQPEDGAYVLFTSGSTGRPKGVEIPHRALANLFAYLHREPGITAADRLLAVTTLSFDIATLELLLPLTVGAEVAIVSQETAMDAQELAIEIDRRGATIMQATPATWRALLTANWKGRPDLRIITGGEPLPSDLAEQLLQRTAEVWNLYGPTETCIYSTGSRIMTPEPPITIGYPIANTQAYILNASLEPQPIGVTGELHLGGVGLAEGYVGQPELTRDRFIANPFEAGTRIYKTGDLARWLPNGRIECLGRSDHQIKLRGFRIERGEIEVALRNHPAVDNVAVVLRASGSGEPRLVAYYTVRGKTDPGEATLRTYLSDRLPIYMVPSAFVVLARLPLTPNGKIDLKALPQTDLPTATTRTVAAAENPLQAELVSLWEEILERRPIGISDSFFDLGGHSLLAVRLLSRVTQRWNVRIPMSCLFTAPTIADLAAAIATAPKSESSPAGTPAIPVARRVRREVPVQPATTPP